MSFSSDLPTLKKWQREQKEQKEKEEEDEQEKEAAEKQRLTEQLGGKKGVGSEEQQAELGDDRDGRAAVAAI